MAKFYMLHAPEFIRIISCNRTFGVNKPGDAFSNLEPYSYDFYRFLLESLNSIPENRLSRMIDTLKEDNRIFYMFEFSLSSYDEETRCNVTQFCTIYRSLVTERDNVADYAAYLRELLPEYEENIADNLSDELFIVMFYYDNKPYYCGVRIADISNNTVYLEIYMMEKLEKEESNGEES